MKKKVFLVLLAFLFSLLAGAAAPKTSISLSLTENGRPVYAQSYDVPLFRAFPFIILRKTYAEVCEKRFSGDAERFFGYLNPDIPRDVYAACKQYSRPPVEPTAIFDGESFTYREGKTGFVGDGKKTLRNLLFVSPCEIVTAPVVPRRTVDDLRRTTRPVATFSTRYASSSPARKKNVSLACSLLSGSVVPSGGALSFNQVVGKRTKENGFVEAGVIRYGEYVQGVGGGVCQVSTTLYNAWLLSGQNVPVSRPHSLVPTYVKGGLDAMVSDDSDLVLRNDSAFPRYVRMQADGERIVATIYGEPLACSVTLQSEVVRVTPYDEYEVVEGEEEKVLSLPKPASVYRSVRVFTAPDGAKHEEVLRTSRYLPQKGKKSVPRTDTNAIGRTNYYYKEVTDEKQNRKNG